MIRTLRALFSPPVFEDDEKTRRARLIHASALVIAAVSSLYGVLRLLGTGGTSSPQVLAPIVGAVVGSFLVLLLVRRGHLQFAGILLVLLAWATFAWMSVNLGGIRDPSYGGLLMVVVLTGLVLGGPAGLVISGISLLFGWGLLDAEMRGVLPADADTPGEILASYAALFLIATGLVAVANRGFETLLRRLRENERDMRARNWQLQQMRDSLEERVAERTVDLDRRSRYLEAAARVAYAASEILDPEQLVRESVDLIREAFDLYYVGLFLVDESGEWAVLRAGTGEAGRRMIARHHRIRVGEGMIGWSIAQGQSRFAQRAEEDRVRLATPELPETRAEAALPLRARGRILGAVTVQSREPDFFDEATVVVLQTMADLLAIALSNADLFEESQRAVAAVRRAYGEAAAEAWEKLLQGRRNWGYHYVDGAIRPVGGDWDTATREAIEVGQVVQRRDSGVSKVAIPLQVGDRVLGAINFQRRDGDWAPDDIALLSALADQLAQALDSARLYEMTQRAAARERMAREVTDRMRAALEWDELMQTAVSEIARAVKASRVFVQWVPPEQDQGAESGE